MKLYRLPQRNSPFIAEGVENLSGKSALTIGNFDGCHRGHQSLIAHAVRSAAELGSMPIALTFDPHPAQFLGTKAVPKLFSLEQKHRAFAELGVKGHVVQEFSAAFAALTADEFFGNQLINKLKMRSLVVGEDFRFGRERQGNVGWLRDRCNESGCEFAIGEAVKIDDDIASSTLVRELVSSGAMKKCAGILGRPYVLEGLVAGGDRIGRELGFPTANLDRIDQLIPAAGVYSGYVAVWDGNPAAVTQLDPKAQPAVINVGRRPTVNGETSAPLRVEAHILDADIGADALYDKRVSYYFQTRLRDELRFEGRDALVRQIEKDIDQARTTFGDRR